MVKNYKKIILISILSSCFSFSAFAKKPNLSSTKLTDIKVVKGFSAPESVVVDDNFYYVSNVGKKLEPSTKDGDGFISKLSKSGEILDLKFLPVSENLNAPKGMTIINNVLYVADIDRVVGFDLKTKQKTFELNIPNTIFLNDICEKDSTSFFVSSTDLGKIFEVDITKKSFSEVEINEDLTGVNGLFYRDEKLFFNTMGDKKTIKGFIGSVSLKKDGAKVKKIEDTDGTFDGLVVFKNGTMISTDWDKGPEGGRLVFVNKKGVGLDLDTTEVIKGPADLCYDESNKTVIIPAMMENKILMKKLSF